MSNTETLAAEILTLTQSVAPEVGAWRATADLFGEEWLVTVDNDSNDGSDNLELEVEFAVGATKKEKVAAILKAIHGRADAADAVEAESRYERSMLACDH